MAPIRGSKKRKKGDNEIAEPVDWWDDFSKSFSGPLSKSKDAATFESFFKITRKTFFYICSLVKHEMMAKPGNFFGSDGNPLSLNDRVAVALRRLSSGESFSSVGNSVGVNRSTAAQITWRFVEAMEERGLHHLSWPSTEAEMNEIKYEFEEILGLPNCCGAIDTTHILMSLSTVDKSNNIWYDEEKNHSMILQAIVDPDMRFRDIVTGWPGSVKDSLVLKSSSFFKQAEAGKRLNGTKFKLSDGIALREYIVGDRGFPLMPWLLTPYQGHSLSDSQLYFNKRQFATRMVAQKALLKLKDTWRILKAVLRKPDKNKLPRIVLVCCLLHNIIIDMDDEVQMQDGMVWSRHHDPGYHQQVCDSSDKSASKLRDKLSLYLSR